MQAQTEVLRLQSNARALGAVFQDAGEVILHLLEFALAFAMFTQEANAINLKQLIKLRLTQPFFMPGSAGIWLRTSFDSGNEFHELNQMHKLLYCILSM